jgi:hypothetical protein
VRAFLVVLMVVVGLGICGCSKKEATQEQATTQSKSEEATGMMPGSDVTKTPGVEVIPPNDVPEAPIEGLSLNPYFDEAGTRTEISVAPNGQFKLYIMAQTVEPYPTGSAQLRLQMPPGINVLYTVETEKKLSSLGKYDYNYMVAYDCTPPGRFVVVAYVCQAAADFAGGEIQVEPGFLSDNATFLGFATCEFTEVRASGGKATIKLKK